jgi:hypothetical protein
MDSDDKMDEFDEECIEGSFANERLKNMSTDTQSFRIGIFKKLLHLEKRISQMSCVGNPETVKEHKALLDDLKTSDNKLDKSLGLLAQAVESGNKATLEAIADLRKARDTNAENIVLLGKEITTVKGKIAQGRTTARTIVWCVAIFWTLSTAILGAIFILHDKIPHDADKTVTPLPTATSPITSTVNSKPKAGGTP